MLGFTPFKKHANKFSYTPRYYDPRKEAREQRRAELHGERSEDAGKEYVPGQYLRRQHEARAVRRDEDARRGRKRLWSAVLGIVLILLFVAILYPRLASLFQQAAQGPRRPITAVEEYGDFDPYAPITVVPNDYEQE